MKCTKEQAIIEAVNYAKGDWVCNARHVTYGYKITMDEFLTCCRDMRRALWMLDK